MTPVISRALMLDIKQTELTITDLENMQQLVAIRLSMQSTRCVVKGLFMAFQCQEVHRIGNICALECQFLLGFSIAFMLFIR